MTTASISLKYLLDGQFEYMSKQGYEVITISAPGKEIEQVREAGIEHIAVDLSRTINPISDLKSLFKLIRIFRITKPEIVHTHTPKAGLLGMLAAMICRVKHRIHTVAGLPHITMNGWKRFLLTTTERLTYYAANYVCPNSQGLLDYIVSNKLCRTEKLKIIGYGSSNGIDLNRFTEKKLDAKKLELIKRSLNFEDDVFYFIAIGRLVKDKGIVELIAAFKSINKSYPNTKLILCGDYEEVRKEEALDEEISKEINTHEGIIHVGWTDYVEYYLKLANVLIHASYREGFPNVLLQAGAMKCPIICSEITGNADIVRDRETGLLFTCARTHELIAKMGFAINNPLLLEELANKLAEEVQERYNRTFVHQQIYNFYNSISRE
jgi:glycosyltransferase involved in cell wall biosynthesis